MMSDSVGIGFRAATKRLLTPTNRWDWYLVVQLTVGFIGWIAIIVVGSTVAVGEDWPILVATISGMLMGSVVPLWLFGKAIPKLFRRLFMKSSPDAPESTGLDDVDIDDVVLRGRSLVELVEDQRGEAFSDPALIWTTPELDNTDVPEVARLARVLESMEDFTGNITSPSRAKSYLEAARRLKESWDHAVSAADRLGVTRCTDQEQQLLEIIGTATIEADDPWLSREHRLESTEIAEQSVRDLPPSDQSVISANLKKWAIYRMLEIRAELTGAPLESLGDPV